MASRKEIDTRLGVLIRSGEGKMVSALGIAAAPSLQREVLKGSKEQGEAPRLRQLDLPLGPHLVLTIASGQLEVTLLRPVDEEMTLFDFVGAVPFSFEILNYFLTSPYQGITVADKDGVIRFISPVHEKFLGLKTGEGIGKPANRVIPNSRLAQVVASGKAEIAQLQSMKGVTRVVNRIPIFSRGEVIGAIGQVLFKEPEAISKMNREVLRLRSKLEHYRRELDELRELNSALADLVGDSTPMQRLKKEIATVAKLDVPVMLLGESGTGKELVARAIHALSKAHDRQMLSLNLAAIPSSLIEAELFGYAPGAFTGGSKEGRAGKLELAHDSTLFLDEVGDIPYEVQTKLLRVLEDRVIERLGSHKAMQTNFRLVSATNLDMQSAISSGKFRLDLFYRLSGVTLRIPPLRQRLEDIPVLVAHFVREFCRRNNVGIPEIHSAVPRYLAEQPWPGNVRHLRQRVEEALVFSDGEELKIEDFLRESQVIALHTGSKHQEPLGSSGRRMQDYQYDVIVRTVNESEGNKKRAAEKLGISRSYLYKILSSRK